MTTFHRNATFDIARGFAVIFMVFANAAPLFTGEMPMLLRVVFSLAAPTFVVMSGFMISQILHKHEMQYFVTKGAFIFLVGGLVDLFINKLVPFEGFDVLYLIGFSIPITVLICKLNNKLISVIICSIIILSSILRYFFGYQDVIINDASFEQGMIFPTYISLRTWFIDGWFPIFPWIAYMLSGALIGKIYRHSNDKAHFFASVNLLMKFILIFIAGFAINLIYPAPMMLRHGYGEIFYPASLGIFLILLACALIIITFSDAIKENKLVHKLVQPLGVGVLGIYVLHLIIITYIIKPIFHEVEALSIYSLIYIAHLAFLILLANMVAKLKRKVKHIPTVIAWFIGK